MYAYNPITEGTELYGTNNYTGDLKVDSPNKFMFWSDPQAYAIYKEDMINGKVETLVHGKPVMGIAVDPSRGELYYANQRAGKQTPLPRPRTLPARLELRHARTLDNKTSCY